MPDGVEVYQDESGRVTVYVSPAEELVRAAQEQRSGQLETIEYLASMEKSVWLTYQMGIVLLGALLIYILLRRIP